MSNHQPWRDRCRGEARAQAEAEARSLWRLAPNAVIPFNHRWEHVQDVVALVDWLARTTGADRMTLEAAAWLHDICKLEPRHAIAGAEAARQILIDTDFPPERIEAVGDAIRKHEGMFRPPNAPPLEPLEAAVLWDADKLSKLGVRAIAHFLRAPYDVGLTLAERRERIEEVVVGVLPRTVASMNTTPAKAVALRRHEAMKAMLERWKQEEREIE